MDNVTAVVVLLVTLLMGYFLIRNELVFRFYNVVKPQMLRDNRYLSLLLRRYLNR